MNQQKNGYISRLKYSGVFMTLFFFFFFFLTSSEQYFMTRTSLQILFLRIFGKFFILAKIEQHEPTKYEGVPKEKHYLLHQWRGCSGRSNTTSSTSGIRRATVVTNPMTSNVLEEFGIVNGTNGTYPLSFVTQLFRTANQFQQLHWSQHPYIEGFMIRTKSS